jgi:hypothetical protein
MTFIKDFVDVLSGSSISFLLLTSLFSFLIFFNLLDGRLRSKGGSVFIGFGLLFLISGIFIRPLLYLAIAYLVLMFLLANLGPRVWETRTGLIILVAGGGAFGL